MFGACGSVIWDSRGVIEATLTKDPSTPGMMLKDSFSLQNTLLRSAYFAV